MYKILIQDKCKCFLNSNLNGSFEFSSKDDALLVTSPEWLKV